MPPCRLVRITKHLWLVGLLALGACTTTSNYDAKRSARAVEETIPRPRLRYATQSQGTGAAGRQSPDAMTELASYKVLRRISMFYKLDLLKHNALSPAMAEVLSAGDEALRGCYANRLETTPALRGQIALSFVLSNATGTMGRIARVGGNLKDRRLVGCVARELARLPFNPPHPVQGKVLFSFDVQETVAQAP